MVQSLSGQVCNGQASDFLILSLFLIFDSFNMTAPKQHDTSSHRYLGNFFLQTKLIFHKSYRVLLKSTLIPVTNTDLNHSLQHARTVLDRGAQGDVLRPSRGPPTRRETAGGQLTTRKLICGLRCYPSSPEGAWLCVRSREGRSARPPRGAVGDWCWCRSRDHVTGARGAMRGDE